MKHIIYFHGFGSSPNSSKVKELSKHYKVFAPNVPYRFDKEMLEKQIGDYLFNNANPNDEVLFVGTSLGGYWAALMAFEWDAPAVVFNPTVDPKSDLRKFLGENKNFSTGEIFQLTQEDIDSFVELPKECTATTNAVICTKDEVVDFTKSSAFFIYQTLIDSDDHQFNDYGLMLRTIEILF